jgi:glycerol-1-phosphate dehydrogenase [NAD(P)+]
VSATEAEVVIAPDAIERLGAFAARWRSALVVSDANTREAVGERVLGTLDGASEYVFEARHGLLAGLSESDAVRDAAGGCERPLLVAVGSGVITDVVRHAAEQLDRPFVSVPSAASMDGYSSSVAAMQIDGVKVTIPARSPVGIFADPSVLAAAPVELTRAGLGDLLGKATARVDWLAAHLLYGEPFSEPVAAYVLEPLQFAAANVESVLAGGEAALSALLEGLVASGIAIALNGNSRPASGCEHHASHFWDLLAARGRHEHALHGIQVGYATRFAMRLQRFAFGGGVETVRSPVLVADPLGADAVRWLGPPTDEIVDAVERKQEFIAELGCWPRDAAAWAAVRSALGPSLSMFDEVDRALARAGIPAVPGYLGLDREVLEATFRYSGRLRDRYTAIDFLEGQGMLDSALDAVLT